MIKNNESKVVLYIGFFSLPDHDAAANRVLSNAKAIADIGHTVILVDEQTDYPYESFIKSKHKVNGFDVWSLRRPNSSLSFLKKMLTVEEIKCVIQHYQKIDAVIAYNYPSIALYLLNQWCQKHQIRVIADCTEWYSGREYRFPMSILSAGDSWFRMRVVQKKLDGVICISSFLYNYYKPYTSVVFIPPLVDRKEEKWNQGKIDFDSQKINLVYAGNPGKSKDLLLPVINKINESINKDRLYLRIVGITKEQFLDIYPEAVSLIHGLHSNIEFLGRKTHSETIRIVSSSDYMVFIRPTNRVSMAGFSTKFVEAVTCGTTLITNDTGDLKTFIARIGQGYVIDNIDQLSGIFDEDFYTLKTNGRHLEQEASRIFDYRLYIDEMKTLL